MCFPHIESLESRQLLAATTLRIEVGGSAYVGPGGKSWQADRGFSGGTAVSANHAVSNTTEDTLFATHRAVTFGYSLAVAKGNYKLKLLFADPTYSTAGQRVFSVSAEKKRILNRFDIAKIAGGKSAVIKTIPITVRDGRLSLWFQGTNDNAIVSAIELIPVAPLGLKWVQVASTPVKRFEGLSASVAGKFYLFGGFNTSDIKTTTRGDVYDPATNACGSTQEHASIADLTQFDPKRNKWVTIGYLPAPRSAASTQVIGDAIFVVGGSPTTINPKADAWMLK